MKKNYMKPTMRVVKMQHRQHILTGSGGLKSVVKSVSNNDGLKWKSDGFGEDDENDY